jgi:cell division protein FtsB
MNKPVTRAVIQLLLETKEYLLQDYRALEAQIEVKRQSSPDPSSGAQFTATLIQVSKARAALEREIEVLRDALR